MSKSTAIILIALNLIILSAFAVQEWIQYKSRLEIEAIQRGNQVIEAPILEEGLRKYLDDREKRRKVQTE